VPATISVRDLRKSYADVPAVDGVSFDVQQGEFFGILGPNGAGKTTTLEIIEGLRKPDSGHVTVLGLAAWPRNGMLLPGIGVQLQASSFFERLTAREQIRTFASLYGVPAKNADDMLGTVGLTDQAGVRAEKLSGGLRHLGIHVDRPAGRRDRQDAAGGHGHRQPDHLADGVPGRRLPSAGLRP